MKYTVLENFIPCGTYEGTPGSDEHGDFIIFDLNVAQNLLPGSFLKNSSGGMLSLKEQDYVRDSDNHIIACKYYY